MTPTAAAEEYRLVPIALIDPPAKAARDTMDEVKLADLARSIQQIGLRQPIIVKPIGARYEVVAGHRRLIACGIAGLLEVKALIDHSDRISPEAVKAHENAFREDLNPAEEAEHLQWLLEHECGDDVDRLCELLKFSRERVEGRLLLLRGDPDVLAALRADKVSFSVARELNFVKDAGYRRMYLDSAIRGGVSARVVREWRVQADLAVSCQREAPGDTRETPAPAPQPVHSAFRCVICNGEHDRTEMDVVWIHRYCDKAILRPFVAHARGEALGGSEDARP